MKLHIQFIKPLTGIFLFFLIVSAHKSFGQNKHADKLFARWEFYKAAACYEKTAKKKPSQEVHYKIGECYRMMDNYREAKLWYDKVNTAGSYNNPEFYMHYGQVLKNNEACAEAKLAFNKYSELKPGDTLGAFYARSCDVIAEDRQWDEKIKVGNVSSVNTPSAEFGPSVYKQGLVFASTRRPVSHDDMKYEWTGDYYLDVYYAEKDTEKNEFVKIHPVAENKVNQAYHDGPASFSHNYDTIYISRTYYDLKGKKKRTLDVNRVKIFYAQTGHGAWRKMKPFTFNNDTFSVAHPCLSPDGTKIYFSSDMPGGYGGADLYSCERQADGSWGSPVNLGAGVNTFGKEAFPYVDSTGNLFFSSDGYLGFGGLDICVAQRNKTTGQFKQAKVMKAPFNSSTNDFGIAFTQYGKTGYLSSNRFGGQGNDDIYAFTLNAEEVPQKLLAENYTIGYRPYTDLDGVAKIHMTFVDSRTRQPLDSGKFWRVDSASQKYDEVTFRNGFIDFTVPEKSKTSINVLVRFYDLYQGSIRIPNLLEDSVMNIEVPLIRTPVKERIIVMKTDVKKTTSGRSDQALFDFGKYDIRPDAARQLDSVVYYMQEYPDAVVDISAHTDSRGTAKYNMTLSEKRAQSAMRYLNSKGIVTSRMRAKGYGFEKLVNRCAKNVKCSDSEHQQNRRVEFWIKASFEEQGAMPDPR